MEFFFATSPGKGPCDGTVKRSVACASLQATVTNLTLNSEALFQWCQQNIDGIDFSILTVKK